LLIPLHYALQLYRSSGAAQPQPSSVCYEVELDEIHTARIRLPNKVCHNILQAATLGKDKVTQPRKFDIGSDYQPTGHQLDQAFL